MKQHKENAIKRSKCKEKLISGTYTPLENLIDISSTVGKQSYHNAKEKKSLMMRYLMRIKQDLTIYAWYVFNLGKKLMS